jgi:hypothetical protein
MRRIKVNVTTAADGSATVYSSRFSGKIDSIAYSKTDFADGVDFTITTEAVGESVWTEANVNAAAVRRPRAPTHSQAGVAAVFAAGGTAVLDKIAVGNDRLKFVIAQGGNAKNGSFYILVD